MGGVSGSLAMQYRLNQLLPAFAAEGLLTSALLSCAGPEGGPAGNHPPHLPQCPLLDAEAQAAILAQESCKAAGIHELSRFPRHTGAFCFMPILYRESHRGWVPTLL